MFQATVYSNENRDTVPQDSDILPATYKKDNALSVLRNSVQNFRIKHELEVETPCTYATSRFIAARMQDDHRSVDTNLLVVNKLVHTQ
jgi:hypothetical protein